MPPTLRLAVRDWDYLTPLALGDVSSPRLDLVVDRVGTLASSFGATSPHDAVEMSFSRYAQIMADGEGDGIVGIPNFIMRGFRHRCIITSRRSPVTRLGDLAGTRIGVTGWRDSGNVWTRAALRREGVGVEDAFWFAGRLTQEHPITDRLDGFGRPGRIEAVPNERPMMELLDEGWLDAVFTPFMPPDFFGRDSGFRQVVADFRAAELSYFTDVGYVPGMHLVAIKADLVAQHPWIVDELSGLIDESQRVWLAKRRKYADTTPWMIDELGRVARDLPTNWNDSGFEVNAAMIADFASELHVQGILPRLLSPADLFPHAARASVPRAAVSA